MKNKEKKEKKTIKEEMMEALKDVKKDENLPPEYKEVLEKLETKLESSKFASKSSLLFAEVLMFLLRFVISFIISMSLFGMFFYTVCLPNKFDVLYVALGVSFISAVLNSMANISFYHPMAMLFVYFCVVGALVLVNNVWLPVFEFSEIWVFFYLIMDILSGYFFMKLIRRKVWITF